MKEQSLLLYTCIYHRWIPNANLKVKQLSVLVYWFVLNFTNRKMTHVILGSHESGVSVKRGNNLSKWEKKLMTCVRSKNIVYSLFFWMPLVNVGRFFSNFIAILKRGKLPFWKGQFCNLRFWKLSYFPCQIFYNRSNLKIIVLGTYLLHYFLNFWPKKNWAYNVACTMYHLHVLNFSDQASKCNVLFLFYSTSQM